ncbi:MAG: sigma-70 family RNA polymerase sigma factor [Chitinophagaceae bacterium]|nr:sigma-70 family RNA polymerase sigma factor [Chitinophagaceae bacterium]MCB0740920.1 sigma-70 family RNA polymerase sigma factor [Chitinophagaceae bacterium]
MKEADYHHIDDKELLKNFYADHNNEWLGILLQRYTLLLLGVSMKYLKNEEQAKDCVQQVFLKVIQELHKYKVDYFKSWLYMVAKNHCLQILREKKGLHTVAINEQLMGRTEDRESIQTLLENEQNLNWLAESIAELNNEQQQCVTLFYLQKKSYREVSEATGFTLLQVKSYIQNGKRNLKNLLEQKMKENKPS